MSFSDLPEELVQKVSGYLPRSELGRFSVTSKHISESSQRALYQRKLDFLREKIFNYIRSSISAVDFTRQKRLKRNPYFNMIISYDLFLDHQNQILEDMKENELLFLDILMQKENIGVLDITIGASSDIAGFYLDQNRKAMLIFYR